jgi:hypothetical protein
VGTWSAVALVISYELLMMIIRGAQAPGEQRRLLLQGNLFRLAEVAACYHFAT